MSQRIDSKHFFRKISRITGHSVSDIEYILLCMVKVMESELKTKGKFSFPYIGFFQRFTVGPFTREVHDFQQKRRVILKYPGGYRIMFRLNKILSKRLR